MTLESEPTLNLTETHNFSLDADATSVQEKGGAHSFIVRNFNSI